MRESEDWKAVCLGLQRRPWYKKNDDGSGGETLPLFSQTVNSLFLSLSILPQTGNLLRIAIFNISYIRGIFPEKYFNDKFVPALGVYDALQKKYLRTLLFCVCEGVEGSMIEEYAFAFNYSNSESQEVSMKINRTGNKQGRTFKCNSLTEVTPNQMRISACKMVRTLIQLMRTLDKMPEEVTLPVTERRDSSRSSPVGCTFHFVKGNDIVRLMLNAMLLTLRYLIIVSADYFDETLLL